MKVGSFALGLAAFAWAVAPVGAGLLRHGNPQPKGKLQPMGKLQSVGNLLEPIGPGPGNFNHPAWVQSCKAIYLDVGSNIGVQVRKMYEPEKYPGATVLPLFKFQFGQPDARRVPNSGICALGLEPNPEHYGRLKVLEEAYVKRGWHVHFYPVAAWSSNGYMKFTGPGELPSKRDWGARLEMPALAFYDVNVSTVDLSAFIRSLPAQSIKLMKMDIEGAEYECLSHMVKQNTLCGSIVNAAFAEAHAWGNVSNWQGTRSFASMEANVNTQTCTGPVTKMIDLDDESYLHDVDTDFGGGYPVVN